MKSPKTVFSLFFFLMVFLCLVAGGRCSRGLRCDRSVGRGRVWIRDLKN
jgi:hypothetical protein